MIDIIIIDISLSYLIGASTSPQKIICLLSCLLCPFALSLVIGQCLPHAIV